MIRPSQFFGQRRSLRRMMALIEYHGILIARFLFPRQFCEIL